MINFCGHKTVDSWKERDAYHEKLKKVCESLGIDFDETSDPLKTLAELKQVRDKLAHPKPVIKNGEVSSRKDLNILLETHWDKFCNSEFVENANSQVQSFEEMIYQNEAVRKSGILTSAIGWGSIS